MSSLIGLENMLKHIQLQGYKSIKDLDLELRNINILIGANGSGKSNLISFFKMLHAMMQNLGNLQLFISQEGGANTLLFDGADVTSEVFAKLLFQQNLTTSDYCFALSYSAGDTLVFAGEEFHFFDEIKHEVNINSSGNREAEIIECAYNRKAWPVMASTKTVNGEKTIIKSIQNCIAYQFHNTSKTAKIRQRWDVEDNQVLREEAGNLAPFLLRLRENHFSVYRRIIETIRLITPFFNDFVLEPVNNSVILQWRERETDLVFSSHQASDGTLRTMALITLLLQPEEDLPEVIILDEPELGLHPYAMNIIAGLLQSISHRTQIILATQSTFLIDCFQPEDIIVVERKNRESIFHRLDPEKLQDWLEDYSLSELWTKNVIGGRPSK